MTVSGTAEGVSMYGFESFDNDYAFSGGMGGMGSKDKEKEKEARQLIAMMNLRTVR